MAALAGVRRAWTGSCVVPSMAMRETRIAGLRSRKGRESLTATDGGHGQYMDLIVAALAMPCHAMPSIAEGGLCQIPPASDGAWRGTMIQQSVSQSINQSINAALLAVLNLTCVPGRSSSRPSMCPATV